MKIFQIKKWVCSPHALERIFERQISIEEMNSIILSPDHRIQQGPKWIFAKHFPDRSDNMLAAVLLERIEGELWVVLTVMVRFAKK